MYSTAESMKKLAWSLRRALRMSPTQALFRELKSRGIALTETDALEVFGGDGTRHTTDYHRLVRSLEVWEVDLGFSASLHQNLPGARISITDSFREIQVTRNAYGLIVIDNPASLFGPQQQYCEHFEFFAPSLFRIARPSAVMVVNVVPDLARVHRAWRSAPSAEHSRRRCKFYGTDHADLIHIEEMVPAYRRIIDAAGFKLRWHFSVRRTLRSQIHYLAMNVSCDGNPPAATG